VQVAHALSDLARDVHRLSARELVGAPMKLLEQGAFASLHHDAAARREQVRAAELNDALMLDGCMDEQLSLDRS
jgi:hypothetical protein